MTARTISAAEARAILANEDAESLPFRIINDAGRAAVAQFVSAAAAEPELHSLDAWYTDAEDAANQAGEGAVIIEMSGRHTSSGNPRTLEMDDAHFEWVVNG